jgi:hypothetical protein
MLFRARILLLLVILFSLLAPVPVVAGGWAVITLDELPLGAVAGQPLTVGFTVRQHGRTLMTGLAPKVIAILDEEKLTFFAEEDKDPGHYTATMTLPKEGDWRWSIEAFTMYKPMPVLTVVAPEAAMSSPFREPVPLAFLASAMVLASVAVFVLGLLTAAIGFRRRSRTVMLLTVFCLLAGFALLAASTGMGSGADAKAKSESADDSSLSQVELGRQLFLAKGCITCHSNSKASGSAQYMTIGMGAPDLSNFSASPEALRLRLKDPAEVKSDTMMPNLELSEPEIEALIAFINSK